MRAFFALDIAPTMQCAISKWRDSSLRPAGRAVPAANFHITLVFLGDLTPRQVERLCVDADQIDRARFELRLDSPGYFPVPGIVWIGPDTIPDALIELVGHLQKIGKKAGVKISRKPFVPHLTLFRGYHAGPPPAQVPDFDLACDGFVLFESITGDKGVRYQPLRRWSLR